MRTSKVLARVKTDNSNINDVTVVFNGDALRENKQRSISCKLNTYEHFLNILRNQLPDNVLQNNSAEFVNNVKYCFGGL